MPIIDNGAYYGWDPKTKRAQCGGYPDEKSREPVNKRIEAKYGRIGGDDLTKALGYLMDKHVDKHMYHAPELNCRMLSECRSCGSLRSVDIKPVKVKTQRPSRKSSAVQSEEKHADDLKKRASRDSLASSASIASTSRSSVTSNHSGSTKRSSVSSIGVGETRGSHTKTEKRG